MPRRLKVFLDTSAILAGLNSPNGAAGVILAACFTQRIIAVISPQIIEEAERNIPLKFPKLLIAWQSFLLIPPEITKEPTIKQVRSAYAVLPTSDAPILASALACKPDALVSWNTKDFLRKSVTDTAMFPVLTPGDFLDTFLRANPTTGRGNGSTGGAH
jgi:predicted nucleic acid-binding protein